MRWQIIRIHKKKRFKIPFEIDQNYGNRQGFKTLPVLCLAKRKIPIV